MLCYRGHSLNLIITINFSLFKKKKILYFFIIIHIHIPTLAYTTSVEWEPYLRDSIFNTYNATKVASLLRINKYIKTNKACHLGSATCMFIWRGFTLIAVLVGKGEGRVMFIMPIAWGTIFCSTLQVSMPFHNSY